MAGDVKAACQVFREFDRCACVLCQGEKKGLASSQSTCKKIREAAAIRKDDLILRRLANFKDEDLFFYHPKTCYKNYANKRYLQNLANKRVSESDDSGLASGADESHTNGLSGMYENCKNTSSGSMVQYQELTNYCKEYSHEKVT